MSQRFALLLGAALWAGCSEPSPAPNPPQPPESPFVTFLLDKEFNVDYGAGFTTPTVLIEGESTVDIVYGDFDRGTIKYAGCASYCSDSSRWRSGIVDSSGYDPSATLSSDGLQVAYLRTVFPSRVLEYAYCPGNCMQTANWSRTLIDSTSYAISAAIAADPSGGLHVVYGDQVGYRVRYAECLSGCLSSGNWTAIDLAQLSGPVAVNVGEKETAIAVDASGAVHIVYARPVDGVLHYGTCAATCTNPASWQEAVIDSAGLLGTVALALDSAGGLDVAYHAGQGVAGAALPLRVARCLAGCLDPASWSRGTVTQAAAFTGNQAIGVTGDPTGAMQLAFLLPPDSAGLSYSRDVVYATCATACADSTHWQPARLGIPGAQAVAIAVSDSGKARLTIVTSGAFWFSAMK